MKQLSLMLVLLTSTPALLANVEQNFNNSPLRSIKPEELRIEIKRRELKKTATTNYTKIRPKNCKH